MPPPEKRAAGVEEYDGSDEIRRFRSLFTDEDPFAAATDGPRPTAENATSKTPMPPPHESIPETNYDIKWSEQYRKLVAYNASNGHCNVPQKYPADRSLGQWVGTQRKALKKGTLKSSRAVHLNNIGFQAVTSTAMLERVTR